MPITMNDLTINPSGVDMNSLLTDWEWAMPEPLQPVLITAVGDVFAQAESGVVYFIDVVEGSITPVADDGGSFKGFLSDAQFVTEHMFPSRVAWDPVEGGTPMERQMGWAIPLLCTLSALGAEGDRRALRGILRALRDELEYMAQEIINEFPQLDVLEQFDYV